MVETKKDEVAGIGVTEHITPGVTTPDRFNEVYPADSHASPLHLKPNQKKAYNAVAKFYALSYITFLALWRSYKYISLAID
jgi:hypothetical protein